MKKAWGRGSIIGVYGFLVFVALGSSALAGDLSERYKLTAQRVLSGGPPQYTEELVVADVIVNPVRRFTLYSGDVSGRYIGAWARAAEDLGERPPLLESIVNEILQHQAPDGHFGNPLTATEVTEKDMAMLWGNGRLLIGLLEYYQANPRPEVLDSARRLGDFLVQVAPIFNAEPVRRDYSFGRFGVGYICWTQNIEGLVELFRLTHREQYKTLAAQMAERTDRQPAQHTHGFLSSLRGILDLYEASQEVKYLDQVQAEVHGLIAPGNVLVQGAVPEALYPNIRRDEGCAEADWLRLNLALWQVTGKLEYLENAELTLFNEFSFNQFHTGDFGHRFLTATGIGQQNARAWWCCTLHGLRAFADILPAAFHAHGGELYYDLPVDGRLKAGPINLLANSSLGKDGNVRLQFAEADGKPRPLSIRQPKWAAEVEILFEGRRLPAESRDGYLRISRNWSTGDTLRLRYRMRTRVVPESGPSGRVAIFHGPWLLAVDEYLSPQFFDEPHSQNRIELPPLGKNGDMKLDAAEPSSTDESPLAVPVAHFRLKYIPGGYPLQAGSVRLRPIAEQTATAASTAWELWFRPMKEGAKFSDQDE